MRHARASHTVTRFDLTNTHGAGKPLFRVSLFPGRVNQFNVCSRMCFDVVSFIHPMIHARRAYVGSLDQSNSMMHQNTHAELTCSRTVCTAAATTAMVPPPERIHIQTTVVVPYDSKRQQSMTQIENETLAASESISSREE